MQSPKKLHTNLLKICLRFFHITMQKPLRPTCMLCASLQRVEWVGKLRKLDLLVAQLKETDGLTLVFANTTVRAAEAHAHLAAQGISVSLIHGEISQVGTTAQHCHHAIPVTTHVYVSTTCVTKQLQELAELSHTTQQFSPIFVSYKTILISICFVESLRLVDL